MHQLHDEGFRDTWIGITRRDDADGYPAGASEVTPAGCDAPVGGDGGQTRAEAENWFARFFGEGDESLNDALVRHGVNEADARAAGLFPARSAILTVDGSNHPELAAQSERMA